MRKTTVSLAILSIFALTMTSSAIGASGICPITYETFEIAVPHIDMENCPDPEKNTGMFCRASVGGDMLHVFYFAEQDNQCLLQVKSFDEDEFSLTAK